MGWKCNVPGCKSGYAPLKKELEYPTVEETKISFHKFPIDPDLRQEWLKNIKRDNWEPFPNSHVCSLHFKEDDFQINSKDGNKYRKKPLSWDCDKLVQRRLLPNAVPTVFSNSSSAIRKSSHRKRYKESSDGDFGEDEEMERDNSNELGFFTNGEEYPLPLSTLKVL